jgi:acyl-CoA thioesterase
MGDLAADTAIEAVGPGRYRAHISKDWELWGPSGGYLAAIALRTAGAHTRMAKPASISCHYLAIGRFTAVELEVTTLQSGRRAESLRVSMVQDGKLILEAIVRTVAAEVAALQQQLARMPDVPMPDELPSAASTVLGGARWSSAPFWQRIEVRPAFLAGEVGHEALVRGWDRFQPRGTFAGDTWLDASRVVVLIDCVPFPAARAGLPGGSYIAPSLDLYVAFHDAAPEQEWLLVEGRGLAAAGGLVSGRAHVWSEDGRPLASGMQQMLCQESRNRSS